MLGKLLKYELKATCRTFLPVYVALLLVALVNRLFRVSNVDMGFSLTTMVLVGLFIALGVLTLIVLIQRFNKNLLGDEGYLMFTLPVKSSQLVLSKLITTFIWSIASAIVGGLTFAILLGDILMLQEFLAVWPELWSTFIELVKYEFGSNSTLFIVAMPLAGLLSYAQAILMIYLALATGQLPIFAKHRGIISFVTFFAMNIILQFGMGLIGTYTPINDLSNIVLLIVALVTMLIIDTGLFLGIKYILNKHLNLE